MTAVLSRKRSNQGNKTENFTLNSTQAADQEIFLAMTPLTRESVYLSLPNGTNQILGADYEVDGNRVYWGGLALETALEENDKVTIIYSVS